MSNVVNLNKERKKRARLEKEQTAEENRAKHGRTKAQKKLDLETEKKKQQFVDSHQLDEPNKD